MCDLEAIGVPSMFKLIRSASALTRMLPTLDLTFEENAARRIGSWLALNELLKLQESCQFPGEPVNIKATNSPWRPSRRTSNSRHRGNSMRGTIIIVSTVL